MNYSDTERIEAYMKALGLNPSKSFKKADIIIFNTCSIRQKAEDKVLGHMKKIDAMKERGKNIIVIITGCMARISSSRYSEKRDSLINRVKEIDIVIKNEELPRLAGLIREINPKIKIQEIKEENLEDYFKIKPTYETCKSRTQAFLPISNGCDKFCAYCIVPYSRGREKSRKIEDILEEAEELAKNGFKEITLVGQTVNSYGLSNYDVKNKTFAHLKGKKPFVYLLEQLDKLHEKGISRIRFISSHPKDISDDLINAMASLKTQMPYLHLPVQSGDNETLKRMNRPYTVKQYEQIIKKLRKKIPGISITTDLIVGFCGETEKEFKNTCKFFKKTGFEHAYIAQYSERKGTTASKISKDDIPTKVKRERWNILNDLIGENSEKSLKKFIGKTVQVLVEAKKGDNQIGRSEHFKEVHFKSRKNLLGKIVPIKVTEAKKWHLIGKLS